MVHYIPVLRENLCPEAKADYVSVILLGWRSEDLAEVNCRKCLAAVKEANRINGLARLAVALQAN